MTRKNKSRWDRAKTADPEFTTLRVCRPGSKPLVTVVPKTVQERITEEYAMLGWGDPDGSADIHR